MAHTLFGSVDCQLDPAGWSADGGVGRSTLVAALGGLLALAAPGPVMAGRRWSGYCTALYAGGVPSETAIWGYSGD